MKKILIGICILSSTTLFGQDNRDNGKVYLMRSEGLQAPAAAFSVFIDHKIFCRLNNKRFAILDVKAGSHTFSSQFSGKKSKGKAEKIEEQIEAGKTYYLKLDFQHGFFKNKLHFKEMDENAAKKSLTGLEQVKNLQ
jgi:Protein of unknown function (DUF2846)